MKTRLTFFIMLATIACYSQVQRPLEVVQDVINYGDSITLYGGDIFLRNDNLYPAYVPRITDSLYSGGAPTWAQLQSTLGIPDTVEGRNFQLYSPSFESMYFVSDGVNWIGSAVTYNTISQWRLNIQDSIHHDWDSYDMIYPGDSLPPDIDTGNIVFYVSNYTEGVGIPFTIYDIYGTQLDARLGRGFIEFDGEYPLWYDWERVGANDTLSIEYVVDRSKIDFGVEDHVVATFEVSYPRIWPPTDGVQPPAEPYIGKSFAVKIMKNGE